jgi:predicted TIM-barrel fold metal-dependent hydrolase
MPLTFEHVPYFMLRAANLSARDRHAVESGTLARVIGVPPPAPAPAPAGWESLKSRPKIDTHWHTSGWNIIEPKIDFDQLSREFDAYNYRLVVNSSIRALNDDLVAGNAETLAFMQKDKRVRGLIVINPHQPELSIAEIEKYRIMPGFVGVKTIQDFYGMELHDPAYDRILDHVRGLSGFSVMAHLPGLRQAAEKYPDLRFIAAHSTWNYKPLTGLKNVWFDIATSTPLRNESDIAGLIAAVGPKRVIFSSDGQLMNPAWTLGKLASLALAEDTLTRIFEKNAFDAFPRLSATT